MAADSLNLGKLGLQWDEQRRNLLDNAEPHIHFLLTPTSKAQALLSGISAGEGKYWAMIGLVVCFLRISDTRRHFNPSALPGD